MAPTSACAFGLQSPKPSLIFRCLISYDSVLHGAAERGTSGRVKLLTLRRAFGHPVTSLPFLPVISHGGCLRFCAARTSVTQLVVL